MSCFTKSFILRATVLPLTLRLSIQLFKRVFHLELLFIFLKFRDKIATGSFDKTCKLWCADTGKCFHTFRGHMAEIVSMTSCFN